MQHYAYIDESGTKDDQEIMTVALVLFEGAFIAHKVHKLLTRELFPNCSKPDKKRKKPSGLHYADMNDKNQNQRLSAGEILAKQSIQCFASCFYHDGTEKSHEQRFEIYTSLIKICLKDALDFHQHLDVTIAQQGNWESYEGPLTNQLDAIVAEQSARLGFRKASFGFESAAKPGIQIADFYAGSIRGHLLKHKDSSLGASFELIEHQVRDIKIHGVDLTAKAKG